MSLRIGIALSGGGARCIAQLGTLKFLEECGIKPSVISGTSAGAIAGAFYAAGYTGQEIRKIVKKNNIFNISNILIKKPGLYSMKGFEKIFSEYFKSHSFHDLNIPLHVAATDLIRGEIVYFSSGNLSQALLASSCIPVLFQPVSYQNTLFVDGGILNNLPIEPLQTCTDKIIGIYVNSIKKEEVKIHMNTVLDRSVHLALRETIKEKITLCDLFLEPPNMSEFSIFDLNKVDEIYDYGYEYAKSMEKKINVLLKTLN